jgi:hypothetical protein
MPVCDALHFRHGIHNMPVIAFEVEIPIPRRGNSIATVGEGEELNWEIVREAWWTVICDCYGVNEAKEEGGRADAGGVGGISGKGTKEESRSASSFPPLTLSVEMRIIGGSEVILSSQRGNEATCSIEVVSHNIVNPNEWNHYIQRIFDKLTSLCHRYGVGHGIRPHWAKQWQGLTWNDPFARKKLNIADYMREISYSSALEEFKATLDIVGQMPAGGEAYQYSQNDCQSLFSNSTMDYMIWGIGSPPPLQTIMRDDHFSAACCSYWDCRTH